jgi:hypothetical protein
MVTCRSYARHLVTPVLILIGLSLLATPFVAGHEREPSGSNERLRDLLTERYDMLKEMLASLQIHLESGRADIGEWRDATIALHRAEAELCTTDVARIKVYEKLVEAMQTQQDWAARREAAGRISKWQLAEAGVATLQAKIDLERLRLGRAHDVPGSDQKGLRATPTAPR